MTRPPALSRKYRSRLLALLCLATPVATASADIPELQWSPVEVVDTQVEDVSTAPGISVASAEDLWHVVYTKAGDIYYAARSSGGWGAPEPVTADVANSRAPHLALGFASIHVVWEDDRAGHPEVWTRQRDASGWLPEQCLTCDLLPSRDPVIASGGTQLFVAWEEESLLVRQVRGRLFEGTWGPVEVVSMSSADAFEPSVSGLPHFAGLFRVAWVDARDGDSEIYSRVRYEDWSAEERITVLPGASRHPSIHSEWCCGDLLFPFWLVAFEQEVAGVAEVFTVTPLLDPHPLSAVDGIPSVMPNADGFEFVQGCVFCGPDPRFFVTWSDQFPGPAPYRVHELAYVGRGTEGLTAGGLSLSAVGAAEGDPLAVMMAIWVELRDGVPTLVSRRGRVPGQTAVEEHLGGGPVAIEVVPNPCREATAFRLRLPLPSAVRVQVRDVAGRVVREFGPVWTSGATWTTSWDTRDASGNLVQPGIYFAVVSAGAVRTNRAFVVLR